MRREITTWHLEMTDPAELRPSRASAQSIPGLRIEQARIPSPELNRFLYTAVGGDLFWIDRLDWDQRRWREYLERPEVETWVAYLEGTPAGYFELEMQTERAVELVYFGLLPGFTGRGLGGALLTRAVERAWEMGARRVWVHTCSLDSPAAVPAYEARGFRVFREEISDRDLPDESPGPWPGAGR
jgi:GNAT superfamily N-acetyltransferase